MAESFLYLTTKGRTTGLLRTIEIWFTEHAGRYYLVSEKREQSGWVKNIEQDPEVAFSVGTRGNEQAELVRRAGRARILHPGKEPELCRIVSGLMDKKYGWSNGLIVELAELLKG
jgi:hypothetical protein